MSALHVRHSRSDALLLAFWAACTKTEKALAAMLARITWRAGK